MDADARMTLSADILSFARSLGFDRAGIAPGRPPTRYGAFTRWLAAGYHGEMAYLVRRADERGDPAALLPAAASLFMLAANYHAAAPPPEWNSPRHGRIARYAWSADYHKVIKSRLYELDAFILRRAGRSEWGRACVDTAPLLERDFAAQAGLGFIGRNTCLIAPGLGSWTFLAALIIPEKLYSDHSPQLPTANPPAGSRRSAVATCGRCTRCLDACPTSAFVAPYVLDARRCISYLTIELAGPIPADLRPLMGAWVFGCDVCQEVCPYNRRPTAAVWPALAGDPTRAAPRLADLLALDEEGFRRRFRGTAVLRAKRRGLLRNACVAAGNSRDPILTPALAVLLADPEPLVRGHASWALGQIGGEAALHALDQARSNETDPWVHQEIAMTAANAAA